MKSVDNKLSLKNDIIVENNRVVVNSNTIAENGTRYSAIATCNFTDPTGVEGFDYEVKIVAGTVTIGATAYTVAGTIVTRSYSGGVWTNIVSSDASSILASANAYTDAKVEGLQAKQPCDVATTANITLSGTQTIDGIAVTAGMRVLVKNQTTGSKNGIYVCAGGSWSRSNDMNDAAEFPSAYIPVNQGTVNADTQWKCTNDVVTLGVTNIVIVAVSVSGVELTANKGIANGYGSLNASAQQPMSEAAVLGTVVPVNTPAVAGMNPQQTAEALQGQMNNSVLITKNTLYNKQYLDDLFKAIYEKVNNTPNDIIGIGVMGDSVGPHVPVEFIRGLAKVVPVNFRPYPGFFNTSLDVTTTLMKYLGGANKVVNQSIYDGVITGCTITRSGSTATITFPSSSSFVVGRYITVTGASESEYNGTFQIASIVTPGTVYTYTVTGTPATPATGTISGYGGVADFTYMPNAEHSEIMNGGTMLFESTVGVYFDKWWSMFATGPDMGSVQIDLLDFNTLAVVATTTINLYNATIDAVKNITVGSGAGNVQYKLKYTAIGKVVVLYTASVKLGTILPINFAKGTSTFTQNNYSSPAIFSSLCLNLGIKLLTVQAKEENLSVSLPNLVTRLNTISNCSKLIVNSLPDSSGDAPVIAQGVLYKQACLDNNYTYFDGFAMFGSYAELVRMGWQGDGTHPGTGANQFCAITIISSLAFNFMNPLNMAVGVDQRNTALTSFLNKLSIVTKNANKYVDVVEEYVLDPDLVTTKNIRSLYLGKPGAGTYFESFDLNTANFKKNNGAGGILIMGEARTALVNAITSVGIGTGMGVGFSAAKLLHIHWDSTGTAGVFIVERKSRYSSQTVAAGFGLGSDTVLENNTNGTFVTCEESYVYWESATNGAEASARKIRLMNAGVLRDVIRFLSNGGISFDIPSARPNFTAGTNQSVGSTTLVAGIGTVANTSVTANTKVKVQMKTPGAGVMGVHYKYTVSAGVGFTITAIDTAGTTVITDISVVDYYLTELN